MEYLLLASFPNICPFVMVLFTYKFSSIGLFVPIYELIERTKVTICPLLVDICPLLVDIASIGPLICYL